MKLQDITNAANAFCDESYSTSLTIYFANECIALINNRLDSSLPEFTDTADYEGLSDNWLRTVVIPYVCYSIKQNDSSLSEADRFYGKFSTGLTQLQASQSTAIAEDYQNEGFGGITTMDTEDAINIGWFNDAKNDDWPW